MSGGFTKLFSTIITSSIWSEDDKTRLMWITMLASADATGYVSGSIPGMAAIARMSIDDSERAILRLCEPDPYSRTPDHEGRRLLPVEGGWQITNYIKYRGERDPDARREYQRQWDRDHRPSGHQRAKVSDSPTRSDRVRPRPTQAKAKAEEELESKDLGNSSSFSPLSLPELRKKIIENQSKLSQAVIEYFPKATEYQTNTCKRILEHFHRHVMDHPEDLHYYESAIEWLQKAKEDGDGDGWKLWLHLVKTNTTYRAKRREP